MINNPGAITGCSTLLPLKQQVSAAELDNSNACKGAFGDLNHQHLTTFNTSMTNISIIFLSHLTLLLTFHNSRLLWDCFPFFPLLNLKKFIPTSVFYICLNVSSVQAFVRWRGLFARILSALWWFYFSSVHGAGVETLNISVSTAGLGRPSMYLPILAQLTELTANLYIFSASVCSSVKWCL